MSAAYSRQEPEKKYPFDFHDAVVDFCNLIFIHSKDERTRIMAYIFRHTVCYMEPGLKHITLDEFAHGRRRSERSGGGRLDDGAGIKDRANVSRTLASLHKDGVVVWQDEGDKARIIRRYGLNLPSLQGCCQLNNTSSSVDDEGVVNSTTRRSQLNNTALSNEQHGVVELTTRSVVNAPSKTFKKIPLVKAGDEILKNEGNEETNLTELEDQQTTILPSVSIEKPAPAPPASQDRQAFIKWQFVKDHLKNNGAIGPAAFENWIAGTMEGWAIEGDVFWVRANGSGSIHQFNTRFKWPIEAAMRQIVPGLQVRYFVQ